jgi:hypothetical protein
MDDRSIWYGSVMSDKTQDNEMQTTTSDAIRPDEIKPPRTRRAPARSDWPKVVTQVDRIVFEEDNRTVNTADLDAAHAYGLKMERMYLESLPVPYRIKSMEGSHNYGWEAHSGTATA